MNTFSAFRFAARTLLHPRRATHFPCLNPLVLGQVRFKSRKNSGPSRVLNEKIPFEDVYLVNEDGAIVKTPLNDLLRSTDLKKDCVELVSTKPLPIVKVLNKKDLMLKAKERRTKQFQNTRKNIVKEVQLTWGSEKSDLEHKLARVREYLEIGAKVDIVFSTKPKGTPPSPLVMEQKLKDTVEMMADISTEWKPVEWRKNMAAIHLKGIVDPNRQLTPEQVELMAEETAAAEDTEGAEAGIGEPGVQATAKTEDTKSPVPPHPRQVTEPSKPKGYIDLSAYYQEPPLPPPRPSPPGRKPVTFGAQPTKLFGTANPHRKW